MAPRSRWECRCSDPPVLLAMYEPGGQVQIKLRDRYYLASGCVHATCPRCGARHILDLRPAPESGELPPIPASDAGSGWF
ncbi:MAG TPA: hypothetical protein VMM78_16185 [Thermomicrobiales bacterium]|nr:hypothetical protein [Thermomicrobiales bacterium]